MDGALSGMGTTGRFSFGCALACLLAAGGGVPAAADPHNYLQAGTGDAVTVCTTVWVGPFNFQGEGGVCLPAHHVQPRDGGEALISISDFMGTPTSGFYCQDFNSDAICGGSGEPSRAFCGTIYIDSDVDWNPAQAIFVRVHGPIYGSAVLSPCGGNAPTTLGTWGSVTHS